MLPRKIKAVQASMLAASSGAIGSETTLPLLKQVGMKLQSAKQRLMASTVVGKMWYKKTNKNGITER